MTPSIVVESPQDGELIRVILDALGEANHYQIVAASGRSHAVSVAGTILGHRGEPVALAIDADTTHPRLLAEQRSNLRTLLGRAARSDLWCLALFEPEIEIVLVYDDVLVERLFGRGLDEVEQALRTMAPKQALARLLESTKLDRQSILARVTADRELATMVSRAPGMREIVGFTRKITANAA